MSTGADAARDGMLDAGSGRVYNVTNGDVVDGPLQMHVEGGKTREKEQRSRRTNSGYGGLADGMDKEGKNDAGKHPRYQRQKRAHSTIQGRIANRARANDRQRIK